MKNSNKLTKSNKSKLTEEEGEMLLTEGVDDTIMESVSNDPDAVTPGERALENEAEAAADKSLEDAQDTTKHGVVLTGGIDSTVMLYHIRNTQPDAKIIPIVLKEKGVGPSKSYINPFLDSLGINAEIKSLTIKDENNPDSYDPIFVWAEENKIYAIHFAANHDEAEESIKNKNFDFFQQLGDKARAHKVQISTPFMTVTKDKIIQMAVDLYDIDLSKTAPPIEGKDKSVEASDRIRTKAFKQAFSVKNQKWIIDPYKPEPQENVGEVKK